MAKRFAPSGQKGRTALAALVVLAAIAVAFAALAAWSDAPRLKDAAGVIQALATAIAIGLGGVFALFKLQVFRDLTPHLTVSHQINHRPVSRRYTLIDVTIELRNSSKVHVELREAVFRLQKVAPLSDKQSARLYGEIYEDGRWEMTRWPKLIEVERSWDEGELIVEPGESRRESYDFLVSADVSAARVYTFFHNPSFREGGGSARGWGATTVYDMRDYDIVERND